MTSSSIKKLGKDLRKSYPSITPDVLSRLQEFRLSYKTTIGRVFNIVCNHSYSIESTAIVVARIKRYQTIQNKLVREPAMQLNTMADIGGCRVIFKSIDSVYKMVDRIIKDPNLVVLRTKDYNKDLAEDGYRSIHINVKIKQSDRPIEIQIRTDQQHDWATLVEITDLMFDTKLKEKNEPQDFFQFLKKLSDYKSLEIQDKIELLNFSIRKKYVATIMEIFVRKNASERLQWISLLTKSNHKYFIIAVDKSFNTNIRSFSNMKVAELEYFKDYSSEDNINTVLIYTKNPNFKSISKAYSNYLLLSHAFINDYYLRLLFEVMCHAIDQNKPRLFNKMYYNMHCFILSELEWIPKQISDVLTYKEQQLDANKSKEWKADIGKDITLRMKILDKMFSGIKSRSKNKFHIQLTKRLIDFVFKIPYQLKKKRAEKILKNVNS